MVFEWQEDYLRGSEFPVTGDDQVEAAYIPPTVEQGSDLRELRDFCAYPKDPGWQGLLCLPKGPRTPESDSCLRFWESWGAGKGVV